MKNRLLNLIRSAWDRDSGQALAEYALILTMVFVGGIISLTILGGSLTGFFNEVAGYLGAASGSG